MKRYLLACIVFIIIVAACGGATTVSVKKAPDLNRYGQYLVFPFPDPAGTDGKTQGIGELFRRSFLRRCNKEGLNMTAADAPALNATDSAELTRALSLARSVRTNYIILGKVTEWIDSDPMDTTRNDSAGLQIDIIGVFSKNIAFSSEVRKESSDFSMGTPYALINTITSEMVSNIVDD